MEKEWVPVLDEYNPGITKEQWVELVRDKDIFTENSLITFACIQKARVATCAGMATEFGRSSNFYNNNNWRTGERVYKKTGCPLSERDEGGNRFWSVCCLGRRNQSYWEFRIRPELQAAFEETGVLVGIEVFDENAWLKETNFWSGGIWWDEENKLEEFSTNNYWQIGWDKDSDNKSAKEAWKNIREIKVGDLLSFHGYGGKNDLKIYQISKVIGKDEDEGKLLIKKLNSDDDILFHNKAPKMAHGGWRGTLFQVTGEEAINKVFGNYIQGNTQMTKQDEFVEKYRTLLKNTKNLILTGAPGTGKSHLAKQIAEKMGCTENEICFVQFHPSYDYTDFVEGLRPKQVDGSDQIGFERKDGVFKAFCEKALESSSNTVIKDDFPLKPFVFIIDEINRGEVAKIFGELFYCVDPGYRGKKGRIKTQYQNLIKEGEFQEGFFIPENVYIIGTMNDIDRSVESMDFAFRRRFTWVEVKAEDTLHMLDNGLPEDIVEEAKKKMSSLNSAISGIEGLGTAYHIGASYFLKLNNYDGDFEQLWEYHLKGILREYLRGNPAAEEELAKLKKAYAE